MNETEHLTAYELRLAATAITMWESEFGIASDDWTEEFALRDKLERMAATLDAEETDQ